jgi:hypothetical protein
VRLVIAVALINICGVALVAQSFLDRVVGTFPADQTIQIQLPLTSFWFEHSLDQIASSTHVLMGVESVDDRLEQPNFSDPLLMLTGRSFRDAVDLLERVSKLP